MGNIVLPGAKIGIIGGGQLGKMLSIAAQTLGYKVYIWSEEENCPACHVATGRIIGDYTDKNKIEEFIKSVDIATVETEHIPISTLREVGENIPLYPDAEIVAKAQNRRLEKEWLSEKQIPVVPFQIVKSIEDIKCFQEEVGQEIVVKTVSGGYDGKGQLLLTSSFLSEEESATIKGWLNEYNELVAEEWLPMEAEFSVIAARNTEKSFEAFPVVENEHQEHILYRTLAPARFGGNINDKAVEITKEIMDELNYIGLLCVEYFYSSNGNIYVNELAPRPHNSGHYTIDTAVTSQFEQTIRAICGLPLGSTALLSAGVMVNLLGDLWIEGFDPKKILIDSSTKLHLYGKSEARMKRKMGHYTTVAKTLDEAIEKANKIYETIKEKQENHTK